MTRKIIITILRTHYKNIIVNWWNKDMSDVSYQLLRDI